MDKKCTIYQTVDFIGKKWTLLILLELYRSKTVRYSELKRGLPNITPKILSARLKELEKEKLINKKVDASEFPIKCEYSLTTAGNDFINVIKNIKKWALKWKINNKVCEEVNCRGCSKEIN